MLKLAAVLALLAGPALAQALPPARLANPNVEERAAMQLSDTMIRFLAEHRDVITGCVATTMTLVCPIPPGTRVHSTGGPP
jgi:hypothetical protein